MGIIIRQSIKGTIATYIGTLIGAFTTFFILTKYLTQEEIGLTRVLLDAATLLAGLSQLGTNSSAMRYYPYFKDDTHRDHGFFFWTLTIPLLGFLIFGLLFVLFKGTVFSVFQAKSPLFVQYYPFVFPLGFFLLYTSVFETNANVLMRIVVPRFIREVAIRVLLLAAYLLYAFRYLSLDGFVMAFCGVYGLATILNIIYLFSINRISLHPEPKHISKSLRNDYLFYTAFLITAALGNVLTPTLSTFFVSAKLGLDTTGIFAIALYVSALVEIPYRSLGAISRPQISQAVKEGDFATANQLSKNVSLHQLLAGSAIFFLLWINIDLFFALLPNGTNYLMAKSVIFILCLSKLLYSTLAVGTAVLDYSKVFYFSLIFTFLLTIATIFLNATLIPIWGMNGSALANLLAYMIYFTALLLLIYRKLGTSPFSTPQLKVMAIVFTLFVVNYVWTLTLSPLITHLPCSHKVIQLCDALLRTGILGSIGIVAIYKMHISESINELLRKAIQFIKRK